MALDGIRLSDLYSTSDYSKWAADSTNKKLVDYTVDLNPNSSKETISGHLYLNSKIKEAIGEEGFNKLPKMKLQEKLDWVNNNLSQDIFGSSEMEEPEIVQPQMEKRDSVIPIEQLASHEKVVEDVSEYTVPEPGTTLRDWFRDNAGGDYTAYVEANRKAREEEENRKRIEGMAQFAGVWGSSGYKSGETKQLEDELSVMRETNPNNKTGIKLKENELKVSREKDLQETQNAFSELYKEEELRKTIAGDRPYHFSPIKREMWDDPTTEQKMDELTSDLRRRFDEDSTFAYDTFKEFEDEMMKYVPKYKNYHDNIDFMPFTPNEMKDIMAEYYATRQLKDSNEAINFAYSVFQKRLSDNQSLYDKASVALLQDGANILGYSTAAVGIFLNSLNGAWGATSNKYDMDDVGWWKEFLYYAADNPVTRYGNNVVRTGTWSPVLQEQYQKENFNALELFRRPGHETDFLDPNTFFDLIAQSGFTVGGMLIGGGTANVLANSVGKGSAMLATNMLAREGAGAASRIVSKGLEVLGKQITTIGAAYLPAAAEASMDAEETYHTAKNNASDAVLKGMEAQLRREFEDGTFEMWYQRNSRIPYELDPEHPMTEEQQEQLAQLRQQERAYLWDTYQNLRQQEVLSDPEVQKFIETGAKRAAARNLFDEATWIALGDYTISNALGKSFRAVKEKSWRALFGEPKTQFKWVPEGNHYRPVVKEITWADKVKAIGKGGLEAVEEGVEELFQTVDSKLRQDLNQNMIAQYIENRFDPESTAVVSDKVRKNWEIASASLGENLLSQEAVFSFLMGAVSAGLGSPTVFRGIRTAVDESRKGSSLGSALWQGARASIRNPIAENLEALKIKQLEDQQEANDLNRWITAHQDELDTLNDEVAIIKFIDQQAQAVKAGDEATYRDAVMGQKVATMLMMERINPNGVKANFYARIQKLSELSAADPEARDVLEQALAYRGDQGITRTTEGPLNEEETAIINNVKKKASDLLNTYKNLKQEVSILNNQFGNSISRETKDALAYSLIMQKDWASRIESINSEAIKAFNEANPDTPVTPISEEEKPALNALARYGTKENIEKEYQDLLKRKAALMARRKSMYRYEYKSELDKIQKQLKQNRDASKAFAKLEEGRVITAEEILSLGNTERAYLLDDSNKGNFSEEQQKEISRFKTSEGIRGDMVTSLIDAGRLQAKKEFFKQEYENLLRNDKAIPLFDREVRKKASKTWTKAKLATAMEATTYDEFRDAMDKSLQTGEFSDMDRMTMSEIFNEEGVSKKTNEFYQRYKKEEMTRRSLRSIIESSPEFKSLGEEQKAVVSDAVEQVQRDGKEVTTETILAKLFDKDYLTQLERQGIDTTPITKTAEELAKAVEKVMAQKKIYDENVEALKRSAEKRAQEQQQAQDPTKTGKTGGKEETREEDKTVIPKEKYEKNKTKLDEVFSKIAHNFTSRRKKELTSKEYADFMSLYTNDPVGDTLIEDLDTSLTPESFVNNIERLNKAVEGKLYTDPSAKDSPEVVNSLKLIAAMQQTLKFINEASKMGRPVTLQAFIKNSILQLRPDLKQSFEPKQRTIDERKIKRLDSKAERFLTTETEKKWYAEHKIDENLKTLSSLNAAKLPFVLIKDSALEAQLKDELGEELDDDNLPVIIAARVPLKTPGSIQGKDGYNYLYVGLLTESRAIPVAEERNQYNNIRGVLLEQEEDGPLVHKGRVLITTLQMQKTAKTTNKEETTSFRDYLLDKHSDKKTEKEQKEAALQDLKEHYRRVKITVKDGVATAHYSWPKRQPNGEMKESPVTRTWSTTEPDNEKGRTAGAYIMVDSATGVTKPLFMEVRGIDEVNFDDDHSIYQMLSDPEIDIASREYAYNDGNYVRKAIVDLQRMIWANKEAFNSRKGIAALNGTKGKAGLFESYIARYFNLLRPAGYTRGEVSLGVEVSDGEIRFTAWQSGTDSDKQSAFGIPMVLGSMPLDVLKKGENAVRQAVATTMKGVLRNLIYDEEGNIRTHEVNGKQWPIIKFEDNFAKDDPSIEKMYDKDDVALKFLGNIWQARTYAFDAVPESVSVEPVALGPQGPIDPSSANAQQEAIRRMTDPVTGFIDEHEGEHFELKPGETEVTTFIKGGEEDKEWQGERLSSKLATSLGTSVDKLYRVYRKSKGKTVNDIKAYMLQKGAGSWPGMRTTSEMISMLEQFKRIDDFFKSKGEVQIDEDLIFRADIVYGDKKKYLVGKPDIITVDKNGVYHIYDIKTFRYTGTNVDEVPGFNSTFFTVRGKRDMKKDLDHWRKQLSMYKAMIETLLGPGTVSPTLGIIPIRLGYTPIGSVDPDPVPGVGARKVYDAEGKNMYLSFKDSGEIRKLPDGKEMAEPVTRCYDQPIRLDAIEKLDDINPDGWKDMSASDEYSLKLGELKGTRHAITPKEDQGPDLFEGVNFDSEKPGVPSPMAPTPASPETPVSQQPTGPAVPSETVGGPEIAGPVFMRKPVENRSADEIERELTGDSSVFDGLEDLLNQNGCDYQHN